MLGEASRIKLYGLLTSNNCLNWPIDRYFGSIETCWWLLCEGPWTQLVPFSFMYVNWWPCTFWCLRKHDIGFSITHYYRAKFGKNQEFCPPKSKLGLSSHGVHGKNLWVLLLFSQGLGHTSPQPVDNDLTGSRKVVREKVSNFFTMRNFHLSLNTLSI